MFYILPDTSSVADYVSRLLIEKIVKKPEVVLGLATGGTMEPIYARFVRSVQQMGIDVSRLATFNLDEYVGLDPNHPKSYASFMREHLFRHLNFDPARLHIPNGLAEDLEAHCKEYSDKLLEYGGIDFQLLGVGRNGHIGFNEPGTPFDRRCHVVQLTEQTRIDNSRFFEGNVKVPATAITLGMCEIMQAREVVLVATGEAKAPIMAQWYESDVSEAIPFTILKRHANARIVLDAAAASLLPEYARQRRLAVNE